MARRLLALTALAAAFVAAGCGNKHDVTTEAPNEGIWVDVGPLDYHVQGSRILNPNQVPDDRYLQGVPDHVASPTGEEVWFAVFLRIENLTDEPAPTAEEFEIEDTDGNVYTPIEVESAENPFYYQPTELGSKQVVPHPDSSGVFNVAGSQLLFKLPLTTVANRPLEFKIHDEEGHEAIVDLDV